MAAGSQKPTFKDYAVDSVCAGCGRKLISSREPAMWFRGWPLPTAVFGPCCFRLAAYPPEKERAA